MSNTGTSSGTQCHVHDLVKVEALTLTPMQHGEAACSDSWGSSVPAHAQLPKQGRVGMLMTVPEMTATKVSQLPVAMLTMTGGHTASAAEGQPEGSGLLVALA